MSTKRLGDYGEEIACRFLEKEGYKILERNIKLSRCEVDIICKKKSKSKNQLDTVVFVEVKMRSHSAFGLPAEAVTIHKQRRLITAAKSYMVLKHLRDVDIRFDVLEIEGGSINHIEGAFTA